VAGVAALRAEHTMMTIIILLVSANERVVRCLARRKTLRSYRPLSILLFILLSTLFISLLVGRRTCRIALLIPSIVSGAGVLWRRLGLRLLWLWGRRRRKLLLITVYRGFLCIYRDKGLGLPRLRRLVRRIRGQNEWLASAVACA
jgi:hypothetical protein